jgi:hypothetical protein
MALSSLARKLKLSKNYKFSLRNYYANPVTTRMDVLELLSSGWRPTRNGMWELKTDNGHQLTWISTS